MDSFTDLHHHHHAADPTPPFSGNSAHPPYPEMIIAAIASLDDKDGSSRQAIAKYIERHFSNLPPTHPNLLTHHLKRMKIEGHLIMIKHSYALPPPRSVPFHQPTPVMDNHFTDYSITPGVETSSITPRRKPGRPPKPRNDFAYQEQPPPPPPPEIQPYEPQFEHEHTVTGHEFQAQTEAHLGGHDQVRGEVVGEASNVEPHIFASLGLGDDGGGPAPRENSVVVSAKRGRGQPPKGLGSGGGGKGKRGRPKLTKASMVNGGGVGKRGRPKRIGGPVSVPLSSGNVTSVRPKRAVSRPGTLSGDGDGGSVSRGRGRGRPPKNKFRNSFGSPSKAGTGTAVIVTDPHQLVAYQELKSKYEHLQSKAKEVVGVIRPYINPDFAAFGALQELEMLVGTHAIVESEKQQSYV